MEKALIFDASSIITLSMNNLLSLLIPLKRKFKGKFYITEDVKREVIDRPLQIKRFELNALMISSLLKNDVLTLYKQDISDKTGVYLDKANNTYEARGKKLKILHAGEASCIALYNQLKLQKHKVAFVIDERTTRMLCEKPTNLERLLEKKLHTNIKMNGENIPVFQGIDIIRSAELCFIAYKSKIIQLPAKPIQAIDALLYASKFNGCSISYEEIEKVKRLVW